MGVYAICIIGLGVMDATGYLDQFE